MDRLDLLGRFKFLWFSTNFCFHYWVYANHSLISTQQGLMWGDYIYSVEFISNGGDKPRMTNVLKKWLPDHS